jgi:NADPH-dependent 2,4-dienoyl-CoA reductase/sulfur reductase-like enzyme
VHVRSARVGGGEAAEVSASLRQVVIVGAGIAGLIAAETLRHEGYDGRLILVGDEEVAPYDRPPLSKQVLLGERTVDDVLLRTPDQLRALDLEIVLGTHANGLDVARRIVLLDNERIRYDGIIIATGTSPRRLAVLEGLPHVYALRTIADAAAIRAAFLRATHVVVVGGGFIGSEVASSARALGIRVTIVEQERVPLARAIGSALARYVSKLHTDNGVELRLGTRVIEAAEEHGRARLELTDGTILECDALIEGTGVTPNVGWVTARELDVSNGIRCDAALNAGPPMVFAAGDVASWPNYLFGRRMRVEHMTNAAEQGRHAARNLLFGRRDPFLGTNYFWSDQYGRTIHFYGVVSESVKVVEGPHAGGDFVGLYRTGDKLVGVLALGHSRVLRTTRRLLEKGATWSEALATLKAERGAQSRP